MKSPGLVAYVLGFGFPLLLAAAGLVMGRTPLLKLSGPSFCSALRAFAYLPVWFRENSFLAHRCRCALWRGIGFDCSWPGFECAGAPGSVDCRRDHFSALLASTPMYLLASQSAK